MTSSVCAKMLVGCQLYLLLVAKKTNK